MKGRLKKQFFVGAEIEFANFLVSSSFRMQLDRKCLVFSLQMEGVVHLMLSSMCTKLLEFCYEILDCKLVVCSAEVKHMAKEKVSVIGVLHQLAREGINVSINQLVDPFKENSISRQFKIDRAHLTHHKHGESRTRRAPSLFPWPPGPSEGKAGGFPRASGELLRPTTSLEYLAAAAILPRAFFQIDALDLAPRLLGKLLRRDEVVLQITEVESYRPNDSACHGRFGITARTAPVFGPGGHAYVYLCYGLHVMLNIVADEEGVGAAVLIRSCAPVSGLETIQRRRGQKTDKPVLLTGPGKVGQALGLSTSWSNHPLYIPGGLELLDGPEPENTLVGPRVGIDYALPEHVNAPWRFAVAGSRWISAPKNTLKPL
ncbi:DNA-3-methyladenine glycosylase [Phalaenopsis equestris]|uniref:DNA-3-methyladenine glycosylase n=1 Tax=Phalaenopsis equestris TaxID=78828 RepID=UPI0009E303CE|nr:DNA-3-methyladenine glycosylase [Phalaenopsis equestris]